MDSKFQMNVKSSNVVFQSKHHQKTDVLSDPANLPEGWRKPVDPETIDKVIKENQEYETEAEFCRNSLAKKFLEEVITEQSYDNQCMMYLQNEKKTVFPCRKCGLVIDLKLSKFCDCGHSPLVRQPGNRPQRVYIKMKIFKIVY